MKKPNPQKLQQFDLKSQLIQQANEVSQFFKEHGYAAEFEDDILPSARVDIAPPPKPEKTNFNPDQIVDIVTFIEHPYFCNLRPHPWQKLILKCFYMGQEGNANLEIDDILLEERDGCNGCVWQHVKKNEEDVIKKRKQGKIVKPLFTVDNSPCLQCKNFDNEIRDQRYISAKEEATNFDAIRLLDQLSERPIIDGFQSEKDLIYAEEIEPKLRKQILSKCENKYKFQELVLVLGRRSGKSFLVSAIALYELYRLLSMGHPQARYGLMEFDQIVLLNVARNEEQAKNAIFAKIKQTVLASPYFSPHIGKDTELEMRFLTEHDIKENERRIAQGMNPFAGSLTLKCGSSSASGLVGLTCWCIIMDEIAAMAGDNPDSGLDYALYDDLKPSLATFGKDGKIMLLSNPKGPIGLLYDLYENRQEDVSTLIMKLPTWLCNPNIGRDFLDTEKKKNPTEFQMQYGAEFGASSQDPMFQQDDIYNMFKSSNMRNRVEYADPMYEYYCHLDPARTSDYYALAVSHTETIYGTIGPDRRPMKRVVIDHIHFWSPLSKNQPIDARDVEQYVLHLHARFRFKQLSIDQWNSQSSIIKFKSYGINVVEKTFTKQYKESIYAELSQLIREQRIDIYDLSGGKYADMNGKTQELNEIEEAKTQFLFLQKKWKGKRFYIEALSGYKDDICDAVAAVTFESLTAKISTRLPSARFTNLGGRFR